MNDQTWLTCKDPMWGVETLLEDFESVSQRKLRLFAVACCRRLRGLILDERATRAIETTERFADGLASPQELQAARVAADQAYGAVAFEDDEFVRESEDPERWEEVALEAACAAAGEDAGTAATEAAETGGLAARMYSGKRNNGEHKAQCTLLRCIFGNPFRPVQLDPAWVAWNDGALRKLAQVIYDERRFAALPLLADALEDSGCVNAEILAHCRSGPEHARGCWVVDLLTNKK